MNPLYLIKKELSAAWNEVNRPLFPEGSENECFYTELFNYYHSLKGKTIDTRNGESLFPIIIDNIHSASEERVQITKVQSPMLSEVPALVDFEARNWKVA